MSLRHLNFLATQVKVLAKIVRGFRDDLRMPLFARCYRCKQDKPWQQFYRNKNKTYRHGLSDECKTCRNEMTKQRRTKHVQTQIPTTTEG